MTYRTIRLKELVSEITLRNLDGEDLPIYGVTAQKELIPTRSKDTAYTLESYKIVEQNDLVVNFLGAPQKPHLPISMNFGDRKIVTSAYKVFRCNEGVLPIFIWIFLSNNEVFRRLKFQTDGAVREDISWKNFTELQVPLPPIEKQREYVAIYGNLLKLASNHEKSFADLQLISDTYIEQLANKYGTEELGQYIQSTDTRNRDNEFGKKELRGISTSKAFIQSKANTVGVSFTNYKVVQNGQFAYVSDTSRRGDKIALAYNDNNSIIISSIYTTFEIIDTRKLLPEFLLLWFKRSEFDRYARYNSWGSARETFDWDEMKRVRVPVPPVEVQRSIVAIYHALESRKKLATQLKEVIKDISPVLIKDAKDRVLATAKI